MVDFPKTGHICIPFHKYFHSTIPLTITHHGRRLHMQAEQCKKCLERIKGSSIPTCVPDTEMVRNYTL